MVKKSASRRVLVVDDEALIRWSLVETLGEAGYEVEEAADAKTALDCLSGDHDAFDVVVLDYRLPDSDDLTLLSTIRQRVPQAVVIMMTAFGTPEMIGKAIELGAVRVVPKPFDIHEMASLVADASSRKPR